VTTVRSDPTPLSRQLVTGHVVLAKVAEGAASANTDATPAAIGRLRKQ
jgi:hypothetical protein